MSDPLARATRIATEVARLGGRAVIVGGYVRDRLRGAPSKDIDIEVFGVAAEPLHDLLRTIDRVNTVGESFTVYKVGDIDVSLPRRESKVGRGHKGFAVEGDPTLTFAQAASRRDFTINAIGWDPLTGEYLDPFDGRVDLEHRILRMVDARTFGDDSLRVLRALQFAARFDCTLDAATASVCQSIPLDDLPAERIWGEVEKLLLLADVPSRGLWLAHELGVVGRLWPELVSLATCPQDAEWHPEGDVWTHTLMVVDQAARRRDGLSKPEQVSLMLGALLHDLGKPLTTAVIDGRIKSPAHESAGLEPATRMLDRLHVHTMDGYDVRGQVLAFVQYHMIPGAWKKAEPPVSDGAFRRLARKTDLALLARLAEADCTGRSGPFDCSASAWFVARAEALGVQHEPPAPLLRGRDLLVLGMSPGPAMGEVLRAVYERQLDGAVTTHEEAVAVAAGLLGPHAR
jgi:tRNA nucleotidyltransferase (CCA-adding enzyme)